MNANNAFQVVEQDVDFCVVGAGMAGILAAIAAARHGAKVALMSDRPVLGGNASSEIRMWVCGAAGANKRETGIIEEIMLENHYRNPDRITSLWDSVLFEAVQKEPNINLMLNCSCNDAEMDGDKIVSVTGWQTTTQRWLKVRAKFFADCSGDSVLAPLTGADYRVGREARDEFNEDIAPEKADKKTMGMSCLLQLREYSTPQTFIAPEWANKYGTAESLPNRITGVDINTNFWWLELGGEQDSIHDTEEIRDDLLKAALGVWDYIKNYQGNPKTANWGIDWMGFLPGKRESRRYVGDYIMTQNDIRAEGRFDDMVAYGGWPMDDHHPGGLRWPGEPTIFHPAPSPYGIPYRSLYSRNISNLFFAGRNISVTHAALSSTRVMATCAVIGQAMGTAAAMAVEYECEPRGVLEHIKELQRRLMEDDCYLPWRKREIAQLSKTARITASEGEASILHSGVERPVGECANSLTLKLGDGWVEYSWPEVQRVNSMRLVCDSDLNRNQSKVGGGGGCHRNIRAIFPLNAPPDGMPKSLLRNFRIEAREGGQEWRTVAEIKDNRYRLVRMPLEIECDAIRLVPESTWDDAASEVRLFAWEVR